MNLIQTWDKILDTGDSAWLDHFRQGDFDPANQTIQLSMGQLSGFYFNKQVKTKVYNQRFIKVLNAQTRTVIMVLKTLKAV